MKKNAVRIQARVKRIENADMFNTSVLVANRGERGTLSFGFPGVAGLYKIVFELEDESEHEIIVKGRRLQKFAVDQRGLLIFDELNHYRWIPEN